ncbi:D-serine ammonia-lyase [Bacillus sp. FJAT-49736]|uniref:D-serine ammonia-lyase n=1 Tax=Bacillus sp. FJAT-49736 TaxID=2833582 RepID=UPI001BC8CC25|nr:D-serine ammonia-lyase [Bacillus sp. FJAT-49736]MBS4174872.1 D-serine ammonia-lyase [Bacillus sp. FJAT-49736]
MSTKLLEGKTISEWIEEYPLLHNLLKMDEVLWINREYGKKKNNTKLTSIDILDAEERLLRFAPYIQSVFPETAKMKGIIESPLVEINNMKNSLEQSYQVNICGKLLLKCDNDLPISGSIKARGGIYEVLKHAEELAIKHGLLQTSDSYTVLRTEKCKKLFSSKKIAVGSTGNLGLSIGIISACLGFKVTVHMSSDAKQWKKDLLRSKGVDVIEYPTDYSKAVEEGRKQAEADPDCYFIDDENSQDLFLGYAVAASRLKKQLEERNILVDENHPLFVYLPCGVGGGPGGITFGLKMAFGHYVHCFFAEPTHSPSFLIGQMTGLQDKVSVFDFGLDNHTAADGLAVGKPSSFVGNTIGHMLSGCYTVQDQRLFTLLHDLADAENIYLEPSAAAGIFGPIQIFKKMVGLQYISVQKLQDKMENAYHLVWATGGSMVPDNERKEYYRRGERQ